MDGIDAVGEVVTGGLLARAVEPQAGEADGLTHETSCLNCGTALTGPYCATCGQKAHVHRTVLGLMQDFIQGLLNFEGKIWRTLPMLAWCPGILTRRYIAGERARFVSPVALYLFTVFAMFAVLNLTGNLAPGTSTQFPQQGLKTALAEDQSEIARLEVERKTVAEAGKDVAEFDRKIAKDKKDLADIQMVLGGKALSMGNERNGLPRWLRPFIRNARDNPQLVAMKVQDAASKFSWLLIPISLPFMWLLFPFRRRYNAYDHAVFVTYSLSFMMMLMIAGGVMAAVGLGAIAGFLFFVPPFHMYRQLRGAYELGRFSAIVRTMALLTFAFIAAGLFAAAVVAIGASA
jgi:hypothetical protein